MSTVPEVYVVQAGGILNAFATKLLSRRFVAIYSDLLDACDVGGPGEATELDFVIGHEIGHLARRAISPGSGFPPRASFPLLGPAYSRAREYTCRSTCGHAVVDNVEVSSRALRHPLAAGGHAPIGR